MERYVVHVTKECQCKCLYCYETDKTSGHRTWKQTQPLLKEIAKTKETVEIEFLGGEPLLNIKLIKKCYEYLEKNADVRTYYLTTNGLLLDNSKTIEFLKKSKKIVLGISLDGHRIMNQLRLTKEGINTYDKVITNLSFLKEHISEERFMIHMTLHPYNVGYLSDGISELYNKGFKRFDFGIVEKYITIDDEFEKTLMGQIKIISDNIKMGLYPNLWLMNIENEPPESKRTYVRDKNGVVIAESYGRIVDDFTDSKKYNVSRNTNKESKIHKIKKAVYMIHQNNIQ